MDPTLDTVAGCLLGTAVGDALGLPYEGLTPRRGQRLLGPPDRYRLLAGRGMVSDDTEHACLVAQSLIATGLDDREFACELARRLRRWFLLLPAGVGLATARACLKLCVGFGPENSGVWSAGNGPAMRAPLLGVVARSPEELQHLVHHSSRLTHTDPLAEHGALVIALAAQLAAREQRLEAHTMRAALAGLAVHPSARWLLDVLHQSLDSVERGESTLTFAHDLGLHRGVGGFVLQTVPIALHAACSHSTDFAAAIQAAVKCGGDADSTAAITGGVVGAAVGLRGIAPHWLRGIAEWPRTVSWMTGLSEQLVRVRQNGVPQRPQELPAWKIVPRNLLFLSVVLFHGLRRLGPPW